MSSFDFGYSGGAAAHEGGPAGARSAGGAQKMEHMQRNIKVCPRCGATLFADMDTCYGCLYSFHEKPEPEKFKPENIELEKAETEKEYSEAPRKSASLDSSLPHIDACAISTRKGPLCGEIIPEEAPFDEEKERYFEELAFEGAYAGKPVCAKNYNIEGPSMAASVKTIRLKMGEVLEIQINA